MNRNFTATVVRFALAEIGIGAAFLLCVAILIVVYSSTISHVLVNPPGDFIQIVWQPGRELLATKAVHLGYPYPLWT
ncbi:MAG TPA: hypothetical protein VFT99_14890, partial [Roseiflexaceae bacterium]|nr:hypothetical protein [Roseiflexaceae bacterium]